MSGDGRRRTLPIATAMSANYITPLLVMVTSLKEHLDPCCEQCLYLVHSNLPDRWLDRIGDLIPLRPVRVDPALAGRIPADLRFPREAAYPLLLADVLPSDLEAVLFLDADLLVLDDLAALWEEAQGPQTIAAARDPAIPRCGSPRGVKKCARLGVPENVPYFNAGVMRIHLGRWRERAVTSRALDYLGGLPGPPDFLHQEALNAVLWNDWMPLAPRWNLVASLTGRPYAPEGLREAPRPGIVHFAGRFKPWRFRTGSPFDWRYRAYLDALSDRLPESPPQTAGERLLQLYDCRLRDYVYTGERFLWNRRII